VISENVFVRYRLAGQDLGNWVQPHSGVSSYFISTMDQGRATTRIKALVYAPGCAIQTFDIPVSSSNDELYSFFCQPLSSVWIDGALTPERNGFTGAKSESAKRSTRSTYEDTPEWRPMSIIISSGSASNCEASRAARVSPKGCTT
jgi:hypothetical protein